MRPTISRDHPVPVGGVVLTAGEVSDALDRAETMGEAVAIERAGAVVLRCNPDGQTIPRLPAGYLGPPPPGSLPDPRRDVVAEALDDLLRTLAGGESLWRG